MHRLTEVAEWGSCRDNKKAVFEYYDDGQLKHIQRYVTDTSDHFTEFIPSNYTYDPLGRLKTLQHGSPTPINYSWIYDAAGRRVATLVDERMESGLQAVVWESRTPPSRPSAEWHVDNL